MLELFKTIRVTENFCVRETYDVYQLRSAYQSYVEKDSSLSFRKLENWLLLHWVGLG